MVKIEELIAKNTKTNPSELVRPIISLVRPEIDELDA